MTDRRTYLQALASHASDDEVGVLGLTDREALESGWPVRATGDDAVSRIRALTSDLAELAAGRIDDTDTAEMLLDRERRKGVRQRLLSSAPLTDDTRFAWMSHDDEGLRTAAIAGASPQLLMRVWDARDELPLGTFARRDLRARLRQRHMLDTLTERILEKPAAFMDDGIDLTEFAIAADVDDAVLDEVVVPDDLCGHLALALLPQLGRRRTTLVWRLWERVAASDVTLVVRHRTLKEWVWRAGAWLAEGPVDVDELHDTMRLVARSDHVSISTTDTPTLLYAARHGLLDGKVVATSAGQLAALVDQLLAIQPAAVDGERERPSWSLALGYLPDRYSHDPEGLRDTLPVEASRLVAQLQQPPKRWSFPDDAEVQATLERVHGDAGLVELIELEHFLPPAVHARLDALPMRGAIDDPATLRFYDTAVAHAQTLRARLDGDGVPIAGDGRFAVAERLHDVGCLSDQEFAAHTLPDLAAGRFDVSRRVAALRDLDVRALLDALHAFPDAAVACRRLLPTEGYDDDIVRLLDHLPVSMLGEEHVARAAVRRVQGATSAPGAAMSMLASTAADGFDGTLGEAIDISVALAR